LTNFVNELSSELLVHILLYEDQNEITIIHSNQYWKNLFIKVIVEKSNYK